MFQQFLAYTLYGYIDGYIDLFIDSDIRWVVNIEKLGFEGISVLHDQLSLTLINYFDVNNWLEEIKFLIESGQEIYGNWVWFISDDSDIEPECEPR